MAHYFMANHDKRFVAIASPKCGSTAVRSWFLQTVGVDPVAPRAIIPYLVDGDLLAALAPYERILFVRDPLRRLVGFYWNWVVRDSTKWCFLDEQRQLSLVGTTFRDLIEAIDRARRHGLVLQHHLLAQVVGLPGDRPPDHLALVERLDAELAALNRRFGLTGYEPRHPHSRPVDSTLAEPVMDRRPDEFDPQRAPPFERFYDAELAATARRCFSDDVALHASIPAAGPLHVEGLDAPRPTVWHQRRAEIFISIASYRDPFLPFTIRSALEGAHHPERLRFGVCWQAEDGENLGAYLDDPRFRVLRFPYWESRGYGWARAEVQKLYRGERYHLLIDSHSYLAPGWDENLIAQLESKPSPKPVLTTSAPPFTFDAEGEVVLPWAGTDRDGVPLIRCSQSSPNGFLDFQMAGERSPGPNTRTCFMVCNFVFTHGRWIVDVPEDPDMINASHECALSVRTYTHGYDMFVPDEIQVWHLDYRNYPGGVRRTVWETKSLRWQAEATDRLRERLDALIYGRGDAAILGRYGRGTVRSVEEWAANAGVEVRFDRRSSLAGTSPARTPTTAEARPGTARMSHRIPFSEAPLPTWQPLDLDAVLNRRATPFDATCALEIVRSHPKVNVRTLAEVPFDRIVRREIDAPLQRPRSLDPAHVTWDWHPALAATCMLQLRDAFIGDNVVYDAARYYGLDKWWLGNGTDAWQLYRETHEVRHIEAGISIAAWGGEAFQHFVSEALPKLAAVIDLLEDPRCAHVQIVSHDEGAPAAQWFWRKLGLRDRIVQKPRNSAAGFVVHADVALAAHHQPNPHLGFHPRGSLLPIQRRLGILEEVEQNLVLYLGRPAERIRSVANEAPLLEAVHRLLKGTRFELQRFEATGDLQSDVEVFRRAAAVFGPHGGAFGNLAFARPGTLVIEFLPLYRFFREGREPRADFWGLAQAAGLDYWTVDPKDFEFDRPGMDAPVGEVITILHRQLGLTSGSAVRWTSGHVVSGRQLSGGTAASMERYKLYTHKTWVEYGWESVNRSQCMEWEIYRCDHGDPHPPPSPDDNIFYTPSELVHALKHKCRTKTAFMTETRHVAVDYYRFLEEHIDCFDRVLTYDDYLLKKYPEKCTFYPHCNCTIRRADFELYDKTKLVSFISSAKHMDISGHLIRHAIYALYTARTTNWLQFHIPDLEIDLYGGLAARHIEYKLESLKPYMFQIAVENCILDTYFTETIIDCFVTGTIPIYYGTKRIAEFFDPEGILQFSTVEELVQILETLTPELYARKLPAVAANFWTAQRYVLAEDWIYWNTDVLTRRSAS